MKPRTIGLFRLALDLAFAGFNEAAAVKPRTIHLAGEAGYALEKLQ